MTMADVNQIIFRLKDGESDTKNAPFTVYVPQGHAGTLQRFRVRICDVFGRDL